MPSLAEVLSAAYRPDDPSETPMVLPPGPMGWYQGPPHQGFEDWLRSRPDTAPSLPTAPRPVPNIPGGAGRLVPPAVPGRSAPPPLRFQPPPLPFQLRPPNIEGLRGAMERLMAEPPAGGPVPRLTPEQLDIIQGPAIDRRGQGEQHKQRREFTL